MVFSSVPVYLDAPNWPYQQINQQERSVNENSQLLPPPHTPQLVGGATAGSIRPSSMADRARLAKMSQPETPLECPRCESTNTKFCYFNNYSLSQPRHFCKTCRRYWTRGGALRNVPVGGGCRKNKRSKASRSKSPVTADNNNSNHRQASTSGCSTSSVNPSSMSHLVSQPSHLPLLPPLNLLGHEYSFGGIHSNGGPDLAFQVGNSSSGVEPEQWRLQQFPFLTNLETNTSNGLISLGDEKMVEQPFYVGEPGQIRASSKPLESGITQLASVKMEGNQSLNMSKNFTGISENHQYWGGNAWSNDLSGFNSSSTSHLL